MPEARASLLLDFLILLGKFAFLNSLSYCLPVAGAAKFIKESRISTEFFLQPQLSKFHLTPSNILNLQLSKGEKVPVAILNKLFIWQLILYCIIFM